MCAVFRREGTVDGLADRGWPTTEGACRAYRDRYPDAIDCVGDRDWTPLP